MGFTESFERLTPDMLVTNLSEKTATKTVINTIIGKLGQRPAFNCMEMVSDDDKLDAMFSNEKIDIQLWSQLRVEFILMPALENFNLKP